MKIEVDVLGSPSLISLVVSVDVKHHSNKQTNKQTGKNGAHLQVLGCPRFRRFVAVHLKCRNHSGDGSVALGNVPLPPFIPLPLPPSHRPSATSWAVGPRHCLSGDTSVFNKSNEEMNFRRQHASASVSQSQTCWLICLCPTPALKPCPFLDNSLETASLS